MTSDEVFAFCDKQFNYLVKFGYCKKNKNTQIIYRSVFPPNSIKLNYDNYAYELEFTYNSKSIFGRNISFSLFEYLEYTNLLPPKETMLIRADSVESFKQSLETYSDLLKANIKPIRRMLFLRFNKFSRYLNITRKQREIDALNEQWFNLADKKWGNKDYQGFIDAIDKIQAEVDENTQKKYQYALGQLPLRE